MYCINCGNILKDDLVRNKQYILSISSAAKTLVELHDIDENIHITGDKGSHASSFPLFWKDGVRVYVGNTLTISPMNGAVITSISLTSSNATC